MVQVLLGVSLVLKAQQCLAQANTGFPDLFKLICLNTPNYCACTAYLNIHRGYSLNTGMVPLF